jgi:hypothetical protein
MTDERLEIDHVVIGVADLDLAAARLRDEHGLVALAGGRHPAWGTANRIVPLGSTYLELVAVVDPEVAAHSAFGTWVSEMASGRTGGGWAVRTHDMSATAERLGLDVVAGSRVTSDGVELRWQLAGLPELAAAERALPFFIAWGDGTPLPGAVPVRHGADDGDGDGEMVLDRIGVACDPAALHHWLAGLSLPVDTVPGSSGVRSVRCSSGQRTVELSLPF